MVLYGNKLKFEWDLVKESRNLDKYYEKTKHQ